MKTAMKKLLFVILLVAGGLVANAQKFGYVDSQYILSKIPEYKVAQDQLNQLSIGWQKEIEAKYSEIDQLYKAYKADEVLLTEEMKQKRQTEIEQKEKDVKELQKQRFGVNGDLFKKRQELVKPLQDKIYNAVQALAERENLAVIFDKSSDLTMLYTSVKYDKSDEILKDLGYSTGNNSGTNKSNNK
jgi:outer membrane protein